MSSVEGLKRNAAKRSEEAYERTIKAIKSLIDEGRVISYAIVAERAGVSRTYLYNNSEFKKIISTQRSASERKQESSVDTILNFQRVEIERLKRELAKAQALASKVDKLEKENIELKAQLRAAYKY